jgi:hypothetical protein
MGNASPAARQLIQATGYSCLDFLRLFGFVTDIAMLQDITLPAYTKTFLKKTVRPLFSLISPTRINRNQKDFCKRIELIKRINSFRISLIRSICLQKNLCYMT